jgi:bacteriorhodopsin
LQFRWQLADDFFDLPYTGPLCALFALGLAFLSLICAAIRADLAHRFVRCCLISAFIINAIAFFTFTNLQLTTVFENGEIIVISLIFRLFA